MECGTGRGRAMDVDVTCLELPDVPINWLLSNVTVKRRKSWLLAASALASASLGVSDRALALDECGPSPATCTPALNPYATGLTTLVRHYALERHASVGGNSPSPLAPPGVNAVNLG